MGIETGFRKIWLKKLVDDLALVSGSIIVDGLKGSVTARCGNLIANAVTLGFVEDVAKGKIDIDQETLRDEYERRIKESDIPAWWSNDLQE